MFTSTSIDSISGRRHDELTESVNFAASRHLFRCHAGIVYGRLRGGRQDQSGKHKRCKTGPAGVKDYRSDLGQDCACHGRKPGSWAGQGPRSGAAQAVNGKSWQLNVIDALGKFQFAYPDAVCCALAQISCTAMLLPAFARNVGIPLVESATFVVYPRERKHLSIEIFLAQCSS